MHKLCDFMIGATPTITVYRHMMFDNNDHMRYSDYVKDKVAFMDFALDLQTDIMYV